MKILSKLIDIILYLIAGLLLTAAVTSAIWNKPMLFSAVRSNSMYPLFQRGDLVFVKSMSVKDKAKIGDIVVFKVEEGSMASKGWIVHRIIEGDEVNGFITKGDANDYSDQAFKENKPIQRDWIVAKVITIGNRPVKFPLVGNFSLWMEKFQADPYTMPIIAVILALILGSSELINSKKKRKKNDLSLQMAYFFSGITISIIIGATMLSKSQKIIFPYEVSDSSTGIIAGSDIGIIKKGDEITEALSDVNNKGFFPIVNTITTTDQNITFNHPLATVKPGSVLQTKMLLKASTVGKYNAIIRISIFYPFLPKNFIYFLTLKSYWLALASVSLVPGLPFMLYPVIDRKLRKEIIKKIRRIYRRICKWIPVIN